jgi:hypothetical protein
VAFNGAGAFVRVHDWTADADAAVNIRADRMDEEDDGFATGLSNCITKDGQTTVTANIPMNSHKLTGLAAPTVAGDAISYNATTAWTPSDQSGATLVLTINGAGYTVFGNMVHVWASITFPVTANGSQITIGGLPFTVKNSNGVGGGFGVFGLSSDHGQFVKNTTTLQVLQSGGTARANSSYSAGTFYFQAWYPTA